MWHTKMHFSTKCNSGHIAIQWFHIQNILDYQYTKFQPYTFRVQKNVCFCTIGDFGSPAISYGGHFIHRAKPLNKCIFEIGDYGENLYESRLDLDQWFRRRFSCTTDKDI